MTADQRLRAARAFWSDDQAGDDQVQAVMLIAQQKKFRPKFILGLDDERRAKHLAGMVGLPEALAARCLVVYHLSEQREMMGTFLDALGIKHENGLIEDDDAKPDAERSHPRSRPSTPRSLRRTCRSTSRRFSARTPIRGVG
ncbi:MAG: hypothetical protein QM736_24990 [Vicinamibacterales bacterium]